MDANLPQGVVEFPLSEKTARKLISHLAENYTHRIRWSKHVKKRMIEREITSRQILILLKSKRSVFREGPYPTTDGSWVFNLKGMSAGAIIELTISLHNHHTTPSSTLITVWINKA